MNKQNFVMTMGVAVSPKDIRQLLGIEDPDLVSVLFGSPVKGRNETVQQIMVRVASELPFLHPEGWLRVISALCELSRVVADADVALITKPHILHCVNHSQLDSFAKLLDECAPNTQQYAWVSYGIVGEVFQGVPMGSVQLQFDLLLDKLLESEKRRSGEFCAFLKSVDLAPTTPSTTEDEKNPFEQFLLDDAETAFEGPPVD